MLQSPAVAARCAGASRLPPMQARIISATAATLQLDTLQRHGPQQRWRVGPSAAHAGLPVAVIPPVRAGLCSDPPPLKLMIQTWGRAMQGGGDVLARARGWSLVHLAGALGHASVVDLLIARGASVTGDPSCEQRSLT